MKNVNKALMMAMVIVALLATSACKKAEKNASSDEVVIKLPPGLIHIGAQWVDGKVVVESFDPITNSCLLRQYNAEGKVVEGSTKVRLRACRIGQPNDVLVKEASTAKQPTAKPKPAQGT